MLERRIERREDEVRLETVVDRNALLAMQRAVEEGMQRYVDWYLAELAGAEQVGQA